MLISCGPKWRFFSSQKQCHENMRNIFHNIDDIFAGLPDVAMLRQHRWKRGTRKWNSSRVARKQLEQPRRCNTFPFLVQMPPIGGVARVHARVASPLVSKCDGFPRGRSGFDRREIKDLVTPRIFLPNPIVQFAPPDVYIFLPEKSFRDGFSPEPRGCTRSW